MELEQGAPESMNDSATCTDSDAGLAQARSLAVHLAQRRPTLPRDAVPHASNIIQQVKGCRSPEDLERLRPFMAESARRLAAALH